MTRIVAIAALAALLLSGCSLLRGTPKAEAYFDGPELALAVAIEYGDDQSVRELIANGADVSASGMQGTSLLEWAVKQTNMDAFEALLAAGAAVDAPSERGSPLHAAAEVRGETGTAFVTALLEAGADPTIVTRGSGVAALPATCRSRSLPSFEALMGAGADLNQTDRNGGTALHTCARVNNGPMLLRMLERGADPMALTHGASFQDYYYGYPADALNDASREHRHQVAVWLRANGYELTPAAAEWL